jgi:hypothetical protein
VGHREATQTALVEDGAITMVLPPGALTMLFDVPGVETVHVQVDEGGTCRITNQPKRQIALTVSARLPSGEEVPGASVRGCGLRKRWDPSDPVVRVTAPEPCELEAWANDGSIVQVTEPVLVDPAEGDRHIDLVFSWEIPSGLKLQVTKRSDTFEITSVESQAAELLAVGEHILEIEGEPVAELTTADFVRLDAGPPGTSVALRVRDEDGAEREVRVPRER